MYDIPLPKVVADVEAGGPFVTSANALNNLRIKQAEAQYKPLTLMAQSASQLAYSNLLMPQFTAKMLSNHPVFASMSDEQKEKALQSVLNATSGQGTGASIFGNLSNMTGNNQSLAGSIFGGMGGIAGPAINKLFEKLGITNPSQNAMTNNQQSSQQNPINNNPSMANFSSAQSSNSNNYPFDKNGVPIPQPLKNENKPTYNENIADYEGQIEQGKESGKFRAKDIQDFGGQIESGLDINDKYKTITEIINNPEFRTMRENIPFFQDKQLNALSKIGTPAQQQLIGQFKSATSEILGDIIRSFGAQKFRGEGDIANNMKINDNDAFNVIVGKLQSGMLYKNLKTERARIASDLMEKKRINKGQALEMADKQIDGDKIRKDIAKKLDYSVKIKRKRNDGSYEIVTVPVSEARKRGIKNV